jgi:acyl-coenzyme A thioesterase PaaI-like protein
MSADDLNRFLQEAFGGERSWVVEDVDDVRLIGRGRADALALRPGGTVSGPSLMGLADGGAYCQILAHIGPVALAVTSSLNITFLRKPEPADVLVEATFLKLGRKLAVVDVRLRSEGSADLVAQAVVTYAIPSAR